ncbi:MAG: phosphoglycolate phosphatase [Gammaproteobacteria bacterium]
MNAERAAFAGYLFDLDGTLVDTAPDIHAALNLALCDAGLPTVPQHLTRHWVGHGARVLVEQALAHFRAAGSPVSPAVGVETLRDAFINRYESDIARLSVPYPHVLDTLIELAQRGARLAVVTNKMTRLTLPLLNALNMTRHFDCIVCGDTTARPKPAPDPALHAAAALGLAVEDVLFIGDSDTDVNCARAAGCRVVCVADGYNHGMDPHALGADQVIASFRELLGGRLARPHSQPTARSRTAS